MADQAHRVGGCQQPAAWKASFSPFPLQSLWKLLSVAARVCIPDLPLDQRELGCGGEQPLLGWKEKGELGRGDPGALPSHRLRWTPPPRGRAGGGFENSGLHPPFPSKVDSSIDFTL